MFPSWGNVFCSRRVTPQYLTVFAYRNVWAMPEVKRISCKPIHPVMNHLLPARNDLSHPPGIFAIHRENARRRLREELSTMSSKMDLDQQAANLEGIIFR